MVDIASLIINIAIISSFYSLIAIGFTLIYSVGGILNFAHGSFITLGGFTAFVVSNMLGYPIELGFIAAIVAGGIIGSIVYYGLLRFVEDQPMTVLVLSFLVGIVLQNILRVSVTNRVITLPMDNTLTPLPLGTTVYVLGSKVETTSIFIFVSSWIVIGVIFVLIDRTRTGKAIQALSMNAKGASVVGIDATRTNLYTWILAAALAGFAGVLITAFQTGSWEMGLNPLVISFSIVILGGVGSIKGSIVAAYIIGGIETVTVTVINPQLTGVSALLILVFALLLKPEGLFGRTSEV